MIFSCYKKCFEKRLIFKAWVASVWLRPDFGSRSKSLRTTGVYSLVCVFISYARSVHTLRTHVHSLHGLSGFPKQNLIQCLEM